MNGADIANIMCNLEFYENISAMHYKYEIYVTNPHMHQHLWHEQRALEYVHDRNGPADRSSGSPGAREDHFDQLADMPLGWQPDIHWKWYTMASRCT